MSSACPTARSHVRSTTAIRSSAVANRTPWNWRSTSAKTFERANVARFSATVCTATFAASTSISSARSPARSKGRSLRPAKVATQATGSEPSTSRARPRQPSTRSASGRTCLSGRVDRVACWRSCSTSRAEGCRPWEAANASTRTSFAASMSVDRCENSSRSRSLTPATSYFGTSECRRAHASHPHPSASVR